VGATSRQLELNAVVEVQTLPELVETQMLGPLSLTAHNLVPSADEAAKIQGSLAITLFEVHVRPPFVEVKRPIFCAAANKLLPSVEEATKTGFVLAGIHGTELEFQETPESTEVKTEPPPAATKLLPSAEEATEDHVLLGALVNIQVAPESAEV